MAVIMNALVILIMLSALAGNACAASPRAVDYELVYKGGLVSARGELVPPMGILEKLAQTVGVEVLIFGAPPSAPINIDLRDQPPEIVLRTVLRGVNYVVVHNPASGVCGVRIVQSQPGPREDGRSQNTAGEVAGPSSAAQVSHPIPTHADVGARAGLSSSGNGSLAGPSSPIRSFVANPSAGGSTAGSGNITGSPAQAALRQGSGNGEGGSSTPGSQADQGDQAARSAGDASAASRSRPSPVEKLQKIVSGYEKRIADGTSDRQYQTDANLLGAEHAVHDRDRVGFFQEALKRAQAK